MGKGYKATKIVTLNIQGLLNRDKYKVEQLNDIATDLSPAVICIQETWLKTDHTLTETKIQGYSEYRTVRPKRRGGGVSIYIKEGYTVLNNNEHSNGECGVVHMKVKELNTHIASIYQRPGAKVDSFEDIINKLREWILGEEGDLTILGDFNMPWMVDWGALQIENLYKNASQVELDKNTGVKTMSAFKWMEFCEEQGMLQLVKESTRKEKILDLIFSNSSNTGGKRGENGGNGSHRTSTNSY